MTSAKMKKKSLVLVFNAIVPGMQNWKVTEQKSPESSYFLFTLLNHTKTSFKNNFDNSLAI